MKKAASLLCLLFAVFLLNACQTTTEIDTITTVTPVKGEIPIRAIPVDVMIDYIATGGITPQAVNIDQGNLFDNGGFESGLAGWTGCSAGAIAESSNAYEGTKALKVNAGNCFYRSVEVSVGQDLILSCYASLQSGNGWTGLGLGFADASWITIPGGPSTIITGTRYQRYDVEATTPEGSKYVSMWMYSDNPALVDECSLMLEQDPPPPPPPGQTEELLENSNLDGTTEWSLGCGGTATVVNVGRSGGSRALALEDGACLDQSLSASDIALLKGQDFTLTCLGAKPNENSYAAMSIFFDGTLLSEAFPHAADTPYGPTPDTIEITGTAPSDFSSAFVSLYANEMLIAYSCSLKVDATEPPPPGGENILVNNDFESSLTGTWAVGCGGSWSLPDGRNGKGARLTNGACMDQSFDVNELAGNDYSFSCYVKNPSGYASLSIFFDGTPVSKVIPVSNEYQLVEITGTAPNASSGFVSVYTGNTIYVDDCSLSSAGGQPPVEPGTQQWFDRFGGPSIVESIYYAPTEEVKAVELTSSGVFTISQLIPADATDDSPNGQRVINIRNYSRAGELVFSQNHPIVRLRTLDPDRGSIYVSILDATLDEAGNLYVLESVRQNLSIARRAQLDLYIQKFDSSGNKLLEKQVFSEEYPIGEGTGSAPTFKYIVYSANALYVSGKTNAMTRNSNSYMTVTKFDTSANQQWVSRVSTNFVDIEGLATNATGDVYVSAFNYSNSGTIQLTKLNSAGNQLWQRDVTNARSESALVADSSNVYILGSTGNLLAEVGNDLSDGYIWKYDNAGNQIWTSQYATNLTDKIIKGEIYNGDLYVTGSTGNYNDPSITTFVKKINAATAAEVWSTEVDVERVNQFVDIEVDATGVYAGGSLRGATQSIPPSERLSNSDAFVTKYSLP